MQITESLPCLANFAMLDRLTAVPGVLGYRGDKVVDERTGQVLE